MPLCRMNVEKNKCDTVRRRRFNECQDQLESWIVLVTVTVTVAWPLLLDSGTIVMPAATALVVDGLAEDGNAAGALFSRTPLPISGLGVTDGVAGVDGPA